MSCFRDVARIKLTHTRAVGEELLRSGAGGVQVHAAVLNVEGGAVGGGVAAGVHGRQVEEDAAQGGIEVGVLNLTARSNGHQVEVVRVGELALGLGQGHGGAGEEGEEGQSLGVHFGWLGCGLTGDGC
jgi:hypothetical protein